MKIIVRFGPICIHFFLFWVIYFYFIENKESTYIARGKGNKNIMQNKNIWKRNNLVKWGQTLTVYVLHILSSVLLNIPQALKVC